MAVNATPGDPQANSYISEAGADAYFATVTSKSAAWGAIDAAVKTALLLEATRTLDLLFNWRGVRATDTQALKHPRCVEIDGSYIDDTVVAKPVQYATCELAMFIYESGSVSVAQDTLNSLKVGPINLNFAASSGNYPPIINHILSDYGAPAISKSNTAKSVRVTRS
jgi:hypothetical protein